MLLRNYCKFKYEHDICVSETSVSGRLNFFFAVLASLVILVQSGKVLQEVILNYELKGYVNCTLITEVIATYSIACTCLLAHMTRSPVLCS